MEIHISNLDSKTTEHDVRRFFSNYQVILTSQVKTIGDVAKVKNNTYCFVCIDNAAEAETAIRQLNGAVLLGSSVVLQKGR